MLWSFISCTMIILSIPKTINLKLIKDNICLLFISIWSKLPFILSQKSRIVKIYCLFNYPRPRPLLIVTPAGAGPGQKSASPAGAGAPVYPYMTTPFDQDSFKICRSPLKLFFGFVKSEDLLYCNRIR